MRFTFLLLMCCTTPSIFAQDSDIYQKTNTAFLEHFNAQNVEGVFNLYTAEMQEEMTKEGIKRFVNGCYEQFGNLKSLTFIETAEGANSYTAQFDKVSLLMELLLTSDGRISTLQFQEP